ncbi:hypothetical protein BDW68DRAFT_165499 [Aspergillus falconensis]
MPCNCHNSIHHPSLPRIHNLPLLSIPLNKQPAKNNWAPKCIAKRTLHLLSFRPKYEILAPAWTRNLTIFGLSCLIATANGVPSERTS